jgi:effector-binding domain-containing protein
MTPALTVRLETLPSIPLAVIKRRVPASMLSRVVPECCGLVWNAMRAQQAKAGRHVALYLDDAMNVEIGVEALGPFVETDDLVRSATPAGLVAAVTFFGPYGQLGAAHTAVGDWANANGRRLGWPRWEIYGHWRDAWNADPSQIRTDIVYRLAEA